MRTHLRSTLVDCGIAVGGVALALLARRVLDPWLGFSHPFFTFYIAIMFAAWFGGVAPAVVTLGLGAVAGSYFFHSPRGSLHLNTIDEIVGVLLYCSVGTAAIAFAEAHRAQRRRAEAFAESLRLQQDELEREVVERRAAEESLRSSEQSLRASEHSLRASEDRFRRLRDSNIIGIVTTDGDDRVVQANDRFLSMLGYEREEFEKLRPTWRELTPPGWAEADAQATAQLLRDGACTPFEKEYLHRDGIRVPALVGIAGFEPPTSGGIAFAVDLTALRAARQTAQLQARVLQSLAEGVVVAERGQTIAYTNPALDAMFGYGCGELVGRGFDLLGDGEEIAVLREQIELAIRVKGSWSGELRNRRRDGSTFTAEATVSMMTSGSTEYWICVQQDVTQRKLAEEAVEQAEQRLSLAMAAASMGAWELDPREDRLIASTQVRALLGEPHAPCGLPECGNASCDAAARGRTEPDHAGDLREQLTEAAEAPGPDVGFSMERFYAAVHPDDRSRVRDAVRDALDGIRDYDVEFRGLRPDGSIRWLAARARVFRGEDGVPARMTGVTLDVTERHAAEAQLRASEERFRLAAETVASIIYDWDLVADVVYRSSSLVKVLGFAPEEAEPRYAWWRARIHPDDLDEVDRQFNLAVAGTDGYSVECRMQHRDGHWVHVWDRGRIVREETGRAVRVIGSTVDVSERKRAEAELHRRQRELELLLENSPDMIDRLDRDLRATYVNPAVRRMLGIAPQQYLGRTKRELGLPDTLCDQWGAACRTALSTGRTQDVQLQFTLIASDAGVPEGGAASGPLDGDAAGDDLPLRHNHPAAMAGNDSDTLVGSAAPPSTRHLSARVVPEFSADGSGAVESLLCITADVTAPTLAAKALRESEQRFRQFAENSRDVLWIYDVLGERIEYISPGFDEIWGIDRHTVVADRNVWAATLHPDDRELAAGALQRVISDDTFVVEYRISRPDGTTRWVHDCGFAIRGEHGQVVRIGGIAQDVTARREAEEALRQAKEAAEAADRAKDQFLAVLSHELRTPLAPVLAAVQMMAARAGTPSEQKDDLEMIRRNIELEARLIDDLLDLTRVARGKIELRLQPVDAHQAIRRALEICGPELRDKDLRLSQHLLAEDGVVQADPARLQQIVWNLTKNAIKFTPHGGELSFRTSHETQPGATTLDTAAGQAKFLRIDVTDTGIGIEPDALERIFDAFEQGHPNITRRFGGLGLGLSISKKLVEMLGGTLTAVSEGTGRGATFTLRLPIAHALQSGVATPATAPEVMPGPADADAPAGGEAHAEPGPNGAAAALRILLVEDHDDTARVMSRALRSCGHDVRTAASVSSALELAASEPFDLVISDLGLPDGSGHDLMRELIARRSELRGIALSGFGMEQDIARSEEAGFRDHLTKPVDLERLEEVIRRVTEESVRAR